MYLVPADKLHKHRQIPPPPQKPSPKPSAKKPKNPKLQRRLRQHPYEKWVEVRGKLRDAEIGREGKGGRRFPVIGRTTATSCRSHGPETVYSYADGSQSSCRRSDFLQFVCRRDIRDPETFTRRR